MNPHQKTVVFDLDGTLVHSAPDLINALNRTITPIGLQPMEITDVGDIAGQGALAMLERAFKSQGRNIEEKEKMKMFEEFIEHYTKHIADDTRFFEGCIECLDELDKDNWSLAVCTNKREGLGRLLLDKLGETKRFKCITGGDTFDFKKPDSRHLIRTIELAGGSPEKSIMVGDSINDIKAAVNADVAAIGVTFGYSDQDVNTMGADVVIDNFSEFMDAVNKIESKW